MGKRHIPKNLRSKAKKKSMCIAAATFAVCFVMLLLCVPIGGVFGKYQRQIYSDGWTKAQDFYFTSNLLDGGTHTLAPRSTEVTFTLSNHADDLRYSEMDIKYEVTVTPDSVDGAAVTVNPGSGKLMTDDVRDVNVTISDLEAGTYTVTAVGTGGYSKTLTAEIVVLPEEANLYYYLENTGEYILLTVWNEGDEQGTVTIQYTGIPDNTNPNMTDWKTDEGSGGKNVTLTHHESKVFRFFGGTVTVTGATSKIPN